MSEHEFNARFDKLEVKIDKLSEAMISLARAEERLINLEAHNAHQYKRVNRLTERIDDVERSTNTQGNTITIIHRVVWLFIVLGAGALLSLFIG